LRVLGLLAAQDLVNVLHATPYGESKEYQGRGQRVTGTGLLPR
jgi:hypothetical protein